MEELVRLTPAEMRIEALIAAGKSYRHIAHELGIREDTARRHGSQVLKKN